MRRKMWFFPSGGGTNTRYQDVMDYGLSQGYTLPSSAQQILQNQMMQSLIDEGILDALDAFYVNINNGSKQISQVNWVNPLVAEKDLTNWSWTSDEGCFAPFAINSIDPSLGGFNYSLNSASIGYKFGAAGGSPLGTQDNPWRGEVAGTAYTLLLQGTFLALRLNAATSWSISSATFGGLSDNNVFIHLNRSGANDLQYYRNGALSTSTNSNTATSVPDSPLQIGVNNGSYSNIHEFEWCGGSLTAGQVTSLYNIINDYINAI